MRIAVIGSKGLPPKQGGIEHLCSEIYPRMVACGHSVDLYARSSYIQVAGNSTRDFKGVNIISLPSLKLRGIDAFLNAAIAAILCSRKPYDVIHFHALGPSLFTFIPRLGLTSAKIVATCHGLDWQRAKWGKISSLVIKTGERTGIRYADAFTVVSKELQSYFDKTYGHPTSYISNAPVAFANSDSQGTYVRSIGLNPQQYLIFVGRLVPEKCPDLLIRAFNELQVSGWKLVFVGGNSDTSAYTLELFEQARNNPNIVFTGELVGAKLAEVVRNAGLFVLPSNVEGLPLVLLEAMQEKIPVIVSDIPVHQQIVGDSRGLLFAKGDTAACTKQLRWAIDNPIAMKTFAQRAESYVHSNHNWNDITSEYLGLYDSLLSSNQKHTK